MLSYNKDYSEHVENTYSDLKTILGTNDNSLLQDDCFATFVIINEGKKMDKTEIVEQLLNDLSKMEFIERGEFLDELYCEIGKKYCWGCGWEQPKESWRSCQCQNDE